MKADLERDFVGYGAQPPDPRWPGSARLALVFILNFEEGAEYNVLDGDPYSEATLTDAGAVDMGVKGRDLAAESMFEYGSRVGFWRILRAFQTRGMTLTAQACARALERNPDAAAAIRAGGYDVCCHGYRFAKHYEMDEPTERDEIRRAVESLVRTTGEPPAGWYCRYGPGVNTRRLLVEAGGFLYDSNSYADELPYWVRVGTAPHLVIPHTFSTNDNKTVRGWLGPADDFFQFCRDAFDTLYEEGGRLMTVSLHNRVTGHPARIPGLTRFLDHVAKHDGVWIARRIDIARHWAATHPA